MRKVLNFWNSLFLTLATPVAAHAVEIQQITELKIKYYRMVEAIKTSPLWGMAIYSVGAIVIFLGLILAIFFLIMLLHRD